MFRCKCSCGNTTDIPYRSVLRNAVKSCGCRSSTVKRLDLNKLKEDFVGNTINWLTVLDVYRDDNGTVMFKCQCKCGNVKDILKKNVISGHCVSCGCYRSSKEKAQKHSDWYKNNSEAVAAGLLKRAENYKEHPEKLKVIGEKVSDWYKNNPEKVKEKSEKYSKWCSNNKERLNEMGQARSEYFKSHPEIVERAIEKRREFYKNHPEKLDEIKYNINKWVANNRDTLEERGRQRSEWLKYHPDVINNLSNKVSVYHYNRKSKVNYDKLIDIIHPDYIDDLLNLKLNANSIIETKCPICGEYDKHSLHNVFTLRTANYKKRRNESPTPPLCSKCMNCYITSKYEYDIADCVLTFYNGECIRNSRSILNGKELDLYYPEKKIAIEFNGDYWHSEEFKDKDYHFEKFKSCLEKNIILVSIFELEWVNRKDDIILYLKDLFNCVRNSLSFDKDGYMNNNYPSFGCEIDLNSYIEGVYTFGDLVVHTCGYSKLVNSSNKD
jgi:hypothetical protein